MGSDRRFIVLLCQSSLVVVLPHSSCSSQPVAVSVVDRQEKVCRCKWVDEAKVN